MEIFEGIYVDFLNGRPDPGPARRNKGRRLSAVGRTPRTIVGLDIHFVEAHLCFKTRGSSRLRRLGALLGILDFGTKAVA